jgi:tetratricopeptide (TPR) repeat protein
MSVIDQYSPSTAEPFFSLLELQREHVALMRLMRTSGTLSEEERSKHIQDFLRRAKGTGSRIDEPADRDAAQSIIDYWTATVVTLSDTASIPLGVTVLADYDASQADDLADQSSPFKGLFPFGESDASRFFGREEAVQSLLEMVKHNRLIVIAGPSGSGKSSLILAGLLPRLKAGALTGSEAWHYLPTIVPGSDPASSLLLAACPSGLNVMDWIADQRLHLKKYPDAFKDLVHVTSSGTDDRPVFVVVDQFEELFTLTTDMGTCTQFVDSLLSLAKAAPPDDRLIVVLREDFLERAKQFSGLIGLAALFRPPIFTSRELRNVVEEPAKNIGLKFESGIVDDLIKEVINDPSALPLLQFTLKQLWEHREHNRITWTSYRHVGRPSEALKRTAEEVFTNLKTFENQTAAQAIFLTLVQQSVGDEFVRKRVRRDTLKSLVASDRVNRVLNRLVDAGLVVKTSGVEDGDDRFEVAHETLIRNWPRLSTWLHEYKQKFETKLRLLATARLWQESGRKSGYLLSGEALREAEQYTDGAPDLTELINASKTKARQIARVKLGGVLSVILMLLFSISLLMDNNRQLISSVAILSLSIQELGQIIANASQSSSLSAEDRAKILMATRTSYQHLADQLKDHPEYTHTLISLFNDISDLNSDAENWEESAKTASEAQALAQSLVNKKPDDPELQRLLYRSTWLLADALAESNQVHSAELEYQHALDIAATLVHLTNGDLNSNRAIAFIEPKLGDICVIEKNTDCALDHYRKAFAINQKLLSGLAEDDAARPEVQRDLAANRIRIGDVLSKQGQLDEALNEYKAAAAIDEQLVTAFPKDLTYNSNLSRVYNQMASVHEQQGDLPTVMTLYQKSLDIRRKLARIDPSNNTWLDYLATQYGKVGDLLVKTHDDPGAITNYKSAENVWDILRTRMPDKLDWMQQSADVLQKLISLLLAQSGAATAQNQMIIGYGQTALKLRSSLARNSPNSGLRAGELATAYINLGGAYKAINNDPEALQQYKEAQSVIDNFTRSHPSDSNVQSLTKLRQDVCSKAPNICP